MVDFSTEIALFNVLFYIIPLIIFIMITTKIISFVFDLLKPKNEKKSKYILLDIMLFVIIIIPLTIFLVSIFIGGMKPSDFSLNFWDYTYPALIIIYVVVLFQIIFVLQDKIKKGGFIN